MAGDLSHDPKYVVKHLKHLKNYDLVIGSRYIEGVSVVNWPIRRLMLSYGANLYSRIITGMPINDGTGGFKAWRTSLLKKISISYILKMFVVRCPLQKIIDSFLFNKYLTSSVLNIIVTIHRATFYCDYPTSTNVTY